MTLLYAVTPVDAAVPRGLDVLEGNLVAVVHADQGVTSGSDRDAVLAFGRLVQQIALAGPALPMRYGTTAASLEELRLLISEHEEAWSTRLAAVADCCELIVHLGPPRQVVPEPAAEPRPVSGRDYLRHRAEAARNRDAVRDQLLGALRPWLRESRTLLGARSERVAVLLPRDAAARARSRLEGWGAEHPDLELAVTGPWPPFSFCEAST